MYKIDFLSVLTSNYKEIINGIYITIFISVLSSIFAFVLGSVFLFYRTSPIKLVCRSSIFLINCIRNTPLLIIMYLFYKGLPSLNIVFPAITCGIMALSLYTAAYISDALLSGMYAIPDEHFQTASALGLSRWQSFLFVIFPQALRHSILILGSQFMNLVKNSSLVSFITVTDIFYVTYKGIADSYRIYEYFILAIIIYCSLTGIVLLITNLLNKKFKVKMAEVQV